MLTETAKHALEYFCRDWNNLNASAAIDSRKTRPQESPSHFPEETSDSPGGRQQESFSFFPERVNTQDHAAPPLASPEFSTVPASAPACSTVQAATTTTTMHPPAAQQQTGATPTCLSVVKSEYPTQISSTRQAVLSLRERYRAELEMAQATAPAKEDGSPAGRRRADLKVAVKLEHLRLYRDQVHIGPVPGVEVGDTFCSRAEIRMVGLHHLPQAGIDVRFSEQLGKPIAVAIAMKENTKATGYSDNIDMGETIIYSGQGGVAHKKDQALVAGNQGLLNSYELHTPVRVIRGYVGKQFLPMKLLYSYDGLYLVTEVRYKEGVGGNKVFMFVMQRMKNQPPLKLYNKMSASPALPPAGTTPAPKTPLPITSGSHADVTSVSLPLPPSALPAMKRKLTIPSFTGIEQQLRLRPFEPSATTPFGAAVVEEFPRLENIQAIVPIMEAAAGTTDGMFFPST